MLNKLVSIKNIKPAKRVGRGLSSGKGKTAGRGTKGQKSRSGYNIPRRFEGGQTPLIQRLAKKRGFTGYRTKPLALDILKIESLFNDGDLVDPKTLTQKNLIENTNIKVKVLGKKLSKKLKFRGVALNKTLLEQSKKVTIEKPIEKKVVIKKTPTKKSIDKTTQK